jgi:hypothetical protein
MHCSLSYRLSSRSLPILVAVGWWLISGCAGVDETSSQTTESSVPSFGSTSVGSQSGPRETSQSGPSFDTSSSVNPSARPVLTDITPFEVAIGFDSLTGSVGGAAFEQAVGDCMSSQGFTYIPVPPTEDGVADSRLNALGQPDSVFYYFVTGPLRARSEGFSFPEPPDDPNAAVLAGMSPSEQEALTRALVGDPASGNTGCIGSSRRKVYGDETGDPQVLVAANEEVLSRAMSDQDFLAAAEKWSDCMNESGFDYAARPDIVKELKSRFATVFPTLVDDEPLPQPATKLLEDEATLARADLACDSRAGYTESLFAAILSAQEAFLSANPGFAEEIRELRGL